MKVCIVVANHVVIEVSSDLDFNKYVFKSLLKRLSLIILMKCCINDLDVKTVNVVNTRTYYIKLKTKKTIFNI